MEQPTNPEKITPDASQDPSPSTRKLAEFLVGFITGTADIGMALLPLIGLYRASRENPEWRELGFQEWLINDPQAATMLGRVLERAQSHLPDETRNMLILALGGLPA